jgi:hypothetical protein
MRECREKAELSSRLTEVESACVDMTFSCSLSELVIAVRREEYVGGRSGDGVGKAE